MGVQPPNFSWVLPGRLAGLALPRLPAHYQFLLEVGVRHLVSLTERGPPHGDSCPGLTLHRLRIPDFCPPAPNQIDRFVQIVDEANARGEVSGVDGRDGEALAAGAAPAPAQSPGRLGRRAGGSGEVRRSTRTLPTLREWHLVQEVLESMQRIFLEYRLLNVLALTFLKSFLKCG